MQVGRFAAFYGRVSAESTSVCSLGGMGHGKSAFDTFTHRRGEFQGSTIPPRD